VFEVAVSPFAFVAAMLIMTIGSACQASVGIGMALLVAPLLALIEPRFIPGPMLLAGAILAGTTAYRERGSVDARGLGVSLVGLAGGTVIGALMLKLASGPTLPKVFGILVLIASDGRVGETRRRQSASPFRSLSDSPHVVTPRLPASRG
jgi:uncharacterized membrane protein YfcA